MTKYVTVGASGNNQVMDKQNSKGWQTEVNEKREKKAQNKTVLEISTHTDSHEEIEVELEGEIGREGKEEQHRNDQLPTRCDMESMFAALEKSLKSL